MARPRKDPLERRDSRLTLYLTTAELADLEAKARDADRQTAVYARDTALNGKVIIRRSLGDDRLVAALTRIGVNLNQLTRYVNGQREVGTNTSDRLSILLARIDELTDRIDMNGA